MTAREGLRCALAALAAILTYASAFFGVTAIVMLTGDPGIPPSTYEGALGMATFFPISCAAAYVFLKTVPEARGRGSRAAWAPAALVSAALVAVSLAFPPLASADGTWNAFMAKVAPVYGANPYACAPNDFPGDPFLRTVAPAWRGAKMVYGPLWTAVSMLPADLLPLDPVVQTFALRLLNVAAYLAAGFVLHAAYKRKKGADRRADVMLMAWLACPAAIFETANGGHNEGVLVLTLAVALAGMLESSVQKAVLGLAAASLVKIWPVVLFPSLLGMARKRPLAAAKAVGISAVGAVLLSIPFGGPGRVLANAFPLLASTGAYFLSPFRFAARAALLAVGAVPEDALAISAALAIVVFAAVLLMAGRAASSGKMTAATAAGIIAAAWFAVATPWLQPWHLVALLPFVLFTPDLPVRAAKLGWLLVSIAVFGMYFVSAGAMAVFGVGIGAIAGLASVAARRK